MPPEDTIFTETEEQPAANPPAPATQSEPNGGNGAATGAVTLDQVSALMEQRLSPLTEGLQQINQVFQSIKAQAESQQTPAPSSGGQDGSDFNESFYNDPKGTINREFAEQAFPLVQKQADAISDFILAEQKREVDSKYGEGTWDKHVIPDLQPIIDRVRNEDPQRLLDKTAIRNAVGALKNLKEDTFFELRQKALSEAPDPHEETVKKVMEKLESSNLTGGIRRVQAPQDRLSEEHREYIESRMKETGQKPDEKRLVAMMNSGSSFEEWKRANDALKEKS